MKKKSFIWLLLGLIAIAALAFTACGEKGGTIEVTNGFSSSALISVGKVVPTLVGAEAINRGDMKRFSFDEDGLYTVAGQPADLSTTPKTKTVTLARGKTERVTIGGE